MPVLHISHPILWHIHTSSMILSPLRPVYVPFAECYCYSVVFILAPDSGEKKEDRLSCPTECPIRQQTNQAKAKRKTQNSQPLLIENTYTTTFTWYAQANTATRKVVRASDSCSSYNWFVRSAAGRVLLFSAIAQHQKRRTLLVLFQDLLPLLFFAPLVA